MKRLWLIVLWGLGAFTSCGLYDLVLGWTEFDVADDIRDKVLLSASFAAAAMAGGYFALFLSDKLDGGDRE